MIQNIRSTILDRTITYEGGELRPHWNLENTGIYGNSIVAFMGPCDVKTEKLVDWEDKLANDSIRARAMLHFIGEFFGVTLQDGVFLQRYFMVWAEKLLRQRGHQIERRGDDLYVKGLVDEPADREFKLSVSIATASPVSVLIHWGMNIDPTGAPPTVRACGLNQMGLVHEDILAFAKELLAQYIGELEEINQAQCKVKPVY